MRTVNLFELNYYEDEIKFRFKVHIKNVLFKMMYWKYDVIILQIFLVIGLAVNIKE